MYGPCPPPVNILEEDYNVLLSAGIDTGIEDIDLLEQCYEKDATSEIPKYILKVCGHLHLQKNILCKQNYNSLSNWWHFCQRYKCS